MVHTLHCKKEKRAVHTADDSPVWNTPGCIAKNAQCVANKEINGKQCTVLWHIDNLKISHEEPARVTEILGMLSREFGEDAPVTITQKKSTITLL
jgi:hypothetical protein